MKFCAKCGAQMEDGMKFCGSCGAVVSDDAATQQPQYGQTQPYNNYQQAAAAAPKQPNQTVQKIVAKVKKNPLIAIIPLAALVAVIVLIIVIVNVTKYQKIDAKELFRFEFEGLNEHGTVVGELNAYPGYVYDEYDKLLLLSKDMKHLTGVTGSDAEELTELLGDEKVSPYFSLNAEELKKAWNKAKDPQDLVTMRKALLKTNSKGNYTIKAKFDKEKDLKNGDKIKVTVDYDEKALKDAKIKLTNTEFEIEVKNLEDGTELDPFDEKYIKVEFTGIDGEGRMNVTKTSDAIEGFMYDYDYYSDLKNGDKVKITCKTYFDTEKSGDDLCIDADGKYYVIKGGEAAMTKEYEVTGLTELQEVDVFENIAFKYERGTPFLKVDGVDNDKMDKLIVDNVRFYIEDANSLKSGDKFKVKAYSYSLKEEGYKIKGEVDADGYVVKEFTVDDKMPAFVTADNGSAAYGSADLKDLLADKESEIKEKLQGTSAGWLWDSENVKYEGDVEKVDSLKLKDVYVAFTDKNNYSNVDDYVNRVYGVYDVKVKTDDEEKSSASFIAIIYIENVVVCDGKYYQSNSWDSAKIYFYGSMSDFNKAIVGKEGYTCTKCGGGTPDVEKPDDSKPEETTTTTTTAKPEKDDSSKEEKADDSKAEEKKDEEKDKEKETEKAVEKPAEEKEEKAS